MSSAQSSSSSSSPFMSMMPTKIFLMGMPGVGKTTCLQKVVQTLRLKQPSLSLGGFYTQERRDDKNAGNRIGFDIIRYGDNNTTAAETNTTEAVPLARVGSNKPKVGKYSVFLDNIQTHMVEPLQACNNNNTSSTSTDGTKPHLTILDEVGKMELLCPDFFPAVWHHLNANNDSIFDLDDKTNQPRTATVGTLPLPKKPIHKIQQIMERKDVVILEVTRANRNALAHDLAIYLQGPPLFHGTTNSDKVSCATILDSYIFQPPKRANNQSVKNGKQNTNQRPTVQLPATTLAISPRPCPALVSNDAAPKILLLGETASAVPDDPAMAYSERSMWKVLSQVVIVEGGGQSSVTQADDFCRLQRSTLSSGIAIWDILANVHLKVKPNGSKSKANKPPKKQPDIPNDLLTLLDTLHPSIQACCFIGSKAHLTFLKHHNSTPKTSNFRSNNSKTTKAFVTPLGRSIDLVVLPSSSNGNRMPLVEKAAAWKAAFDKYL